MNNFQIVRIFGQVTTDSNKLPQGKFQSGVLVTLTRGGIQLSHFAIESQQLHENPFVQSNPSLTFLRLWETADRSTVLSADERKEGSQT